MAQVSVPMGFCVYPLPLVFHFVCSPRGRQAEDFPFFGCKPPLAALGYRTNRRFCWRTTFRNSCGKIGKFSAVRNQYAAPVSRLTRFGTQKIEEEGGGTQIFIFHSSNMDFCHHTKDGRGEKPRSYTIHET